MECLIIFVTQMKIVSIILSIIISMIQETFFLSNIYKKISENRKNIYRVFFLNKEYIIIILNKNKC